MGAQTVSADPRSEQVLRSLFKGQPNAEVFSGPFLDAVPLATVNDLLDDLRALIGPVMRVEVDGTDAVIKTKSHILDAEISLDAEGRISGLFFRPPESLGVTLEEAEARLADLGDRVAWFVHQGGGDVVARDADMPLAVGSAFKLGVLSALAGDVDSGRRAWADVMTLTEHHLSLPSGVMQDWPRGAPVTLHTAALQMIAISDNTATDFLIDTLGRGRVADALGLEHLLTTREFFALKRDPKIADAYVAAPPKMRAGIAQSSAEAALALGALPHFRPGIEWHVSLRRLCDLAMPLAYLGLFQVNPGPLGPKSYGPVAYKGGSEPGVLAFVSVLPEAPGGPACVAMAVNHAAEIGTASAAATYRALAKAALPLGGSAR